MTYERTPSMSDDAIRHGSGKGWDEWVAILDAWRAGERSHREIAAYVHNEHGVDGWWAQGVAVGYERLKGRRAVGEGSDGTFSGSASKTFAVSVERLWRAWVDETERDRWLPPGTLVLRQAQESRSARFDVAGGGILALWFTDKGAKSAVQLEQEKLPSKKAAAEFRIRWKTHMAALADSFKAE